MVFFHVISLYLLPIILFYLGKSKVESTGNLTDHFLSGPPKYHSLLASHPAEPHLTDQSSLLSLEKHKSLNIKIASYFIETLSSSHSNNLHHRGRLITQTIDHFYPNHNYRRSVEYTWKTLINFIEQWVKYTGVNVTKNHVIPYLLSSSSEINLLDNSMQNRIGPCYTTLLVDFHRHTHGDNAVIKSTVNLAFRIIQPKIIINQKIQQGMKNKGKWKEARYQQVKKWLIMLNRIPEEKE